MRPSYPVSGPFTCVVIEWTSVCLLLYYTKGRQVAWLGLLTYSLVTSSVDGSRHVLAGHTV